MSYKNSSFIPVVFHNLSGYDAHLIIKEITTADNFKGPVTVIPENKERYIGFIKHLDHSKISFRFIDSFKFMTASLEKLASYLENHEITASTFAADGYTKEQIKLLRRKGIFPYDYVSNFDRLKEERLPSKADFKNKLTDSDISDEDYSYVKNLWQEFNIHTLGEYSDLYLKVDILLTADVLESFRVTCMNSYEMDPLYFFTSPSLSWNAMLKYTGVEIELLTDIDMLLFIEKSIRGGVSQVSNRYGKANNKYMNDGYDPNKLIKYLIYLDMNNLYGLVMTKHLPTGGFEWVNRIDDILSIPEDNEVGYFLEVDIE